MRPSGPETGKPIAAAESVDFGIGMVAPKTKS
jgi:hypothetical protein